MRFEPTQSENFSCDGPYRDVLLVAPEIQNPRGMPCVGLGYIASYLRSKGTSVRIVDAQFTKEDPLAALRAHPPTLVGIGVDSRTYQRGLRLAKMAKQLGHTVLLGGLHVSLVKADVLRDPYVDYGIVGDGEIPTFQLLEALRGVRSFSDVSGLIYRTTGGRICENPNISEDIDLDLLPIPDYRDAGIERIRLYPVVTSRDCPYKCTYCTVGNISHGRYRARSATHCVDEIVAAKERYGITGFAVVDENFAVRRKRVYDFCNELIAREVNLPWTAFEGMRADAFTDDLAELLRRSGCRWVFFGIESAENGVLRTVEKGSKFEHIERGVSVARRHGIRVGGFWIVGLPESSFESDMRSLDWAIEHLDQSQFWMSIPYYGTKLHTWVKENARLLRPPVGDNIVNSLSTMPFYDTKGYPAHEIKRAHTVASLRTGNDYFFEDIDRGSSGSSTNKRRLVETVLRWDPSWLSVVAPGRSLPDVEDPVERALNRDADSTLPGDFLGGQVAAQHSVTTEIVPLLRGRGGTRIA